jgi:hypothetical protein
MYLDLATHTASTPVQVGEGTNPTISCDPRNNRTGPTYTPWYEIGYVNASGTEAVWYYNHGTPGTYTINADYVDPTSNVATSFTSVSHVCALVSSVAGGGQYSALYAIVENSAGTHLVMYNRGNTNLTTGDAAYCDGNLLVPANFPHTSLIPSPPLGNGWPILDEPIIAFANPYDNQGTSSTGFWQNYDQFHCLYRLQLTGSLNPDTEWAPLLIIRNADNASAFPSPPDPATIHQDTRLIVNQFGVTSSRLLEHDPNSGYVGAVNQMGIHVHWRTGSVGSGTHFYSRDAGLTATSDQHVSRA